MQYSGRFRGLHDSVSKQGERDPFGRMQARGCVVAQQARSRE